MAGKLTSAQGTGILLVTANVGSLFEDVSCAPLITIPCVSLFVRHAKCFDTPLSLPHRLAVSHCHLRLRVHANERLSWSRL